MNKPLVFKSYDESVQHQLKEWLEGRPWHNTHSDECCPDFSCCHPDLLWAEDMRKQFVEARGEDRSAMLMSSLGCLLTKNVPGIVIDKSHEH